MATQMLRQGDAEVFKRYSRAKLGMMREALASSTASQTSGRGVYYGAAHLTDFILIFAPVG